jgi:xylan 1,4-beta-xylosidase
MNPSTHNGSATETFEPQVHRARATIQNPVLRGFNPDPSILRVGNDYYIATSTFEWYPGVQIHHSRDLVNWRLLTHAVTGTHIDLRGNPDSGGVWAPCLTHDGNLFHLIYTDVKSWGEIEAFKDPHNYLITANDILGPWSEPVYINSSGFDPSLFHDDDGKKWFLNMVWDHRKNKNKFGGILLQEYDPISRRLVGPVRNIFKGTSLGVTEAPHIYKHDGYYYLMTAEGGTSYQHAVTMARSRTIEGPYEMDPRNPMLTSDGHPDLELQKSGHASLVQTQSNEWYIAHLCGRPLTPLGQCNLGRETALQRVEWTADGWLRLEGGGNTPHATVPAPDLPPHPFPSVPERDDFDAPTLGVDWSSLRVPPDPHWLSLEVRPGFLRLYGRESLNSRNRQSIVARRLQAQHAEVTTTLEFEPEHFQQMAGLILYYDTANYHYLRVSRDEMLGRCLGIITCDTGRYDEPLEHDVPLEGWSRVHLRAVFAGPRIQFSYSQDGETWLEIGPVLDAGKLSDEYGHALGFTGTFVGMCAQDLAGTCLHADFDQFTYREIKA